MSKLLRNINPLGYVDLPLIGRQGPAPYLVCHEPNEDGSCPDPFEHEHTELVDEEFGKPGSGCLVPNEEFEVSDEIADGHAPTKGCKVCDTAEDVACMGTTGLLAQVGNYELVKPAKKTPAKRTPKKSAAKKTAAKSPAEVRDDLGLPPIDDPKDV